MSSVLRCFSATQLHRPTQIYGPQNVGRPSPRHSPLTRNCPLRPLRRRRAAVSAATLMYMVVTASQHYFLGVRLLGPLLSLQTYVKTTVVRTCACVIINYQRTPSFQAVQPAAAFYKSHLLLSVVSHLFLARHSVRPAHQVGQTVRPSSPSSHPGGMSGHPARQARQPIRPGSPTGQLPRQVSKPVSCHNSAAFQTESVFFSLVSFSIKLQKLVPSK